MVRVVALRGSDCRSCQTCSFWILNLNVRVARAEYQQPRQPCILCEDRGEKKAGILGQTLPTREE